MLRITVHDHPRTLTFQLEGSLAGPWVRVLEECWQTTVTGQASPVPPLRPNGGDLHRRRGPGLPRGHAPPGGRIHRPRLPDESRRGRDHPDNRSRPRASEVTGSSRYRPTERGTSTWEAHDSREFGPRNRGTADTCRGRAGGGAGRLTSATGRCDRPSGPPRPRTRQPIPLLPRRRPRPGRHRTPGGRGCCGRGPWPAWRSEVTPWRRPSRR